MKNAPTNHKCSTQFARVHIGLRQRQKKIVTFKLAMLIRRSVGLSAWADAFYRSHDVLRKSAFNFPLVEVIDVNVVDAVEEMKWKVIDR